MPAADSTDEGDMSETTKVRIGLEATRELEIDLDGNVDVAELFATAMSQGDTLLWLTDSRGHRYGVVLAKVAFIELEQAPRREVGFG